MMIRVIVIFVENDVIMMRGIDIDNKVSRVQIDTFLFNY